MTKALVFLVAIGISVLGVWIVRRRSSKATKITDKRAKAEVLKQLLALSEEGAKAGVEKSVEKSTVKVSRVQPTPVPAMTRQQRRAERRRRNKVALANSQRA
jgi:hypothetical protein